jgi:hypothetical protein
MVIPRSPPGVAPSGVSSRERGESDWETSTWGEIEATYR